MDPLPAVLARPAATRRRSALLPLAVSLLLSSFVQAGTWTDKGGGLPGVAGIPQLSGAGTLVPGTPGQLQLSQARPVANAAIFFSLLEVGVPFKGGTLSAYPPILVVNLVTGPDGGLVLPWSSWPNSLPPGVELYFQFLVADPAAPNGASISNLLLGLTG